MYIDTNSVPSCSSASIYWTSLWKKM